MGEPRSGEMQCLRHAASCLFGVGRRFLVRLCTRQPLPQATHADNESNADSGLSDPDSDVGRCDEDDGIFPRNNSPLLSEEIYGRRRSSGSMGTMLPKSYHRTASAPVGFTGKDLPSAPSTNGILHDLDPDPHRRSKSSRRESVTTDMPSMEVMLKRETFDDLGGNEFKDEDSMEELQEQPANYHVHRRGGLSSGTGNKYANWAAPSYPKPRKAHQDIVQALHKVPIFRGMECLSNADDGFKALADAMQIQEFVDGECIYTAGTFGDSAYVVLEGVVEATGLRRMNSKKIETWQVRPGQCFGEHSMLWGRNRRTTVYSRGASVTAMLTKDVFHNLVTRRAMTTRSQRESYLRKEWLFETFSDEEISKIADTLELRIFDEGREIIRRGDTGNEMFIVADGSCYATIPVQQVGKANGGSPGGVSEDVIVKQYGVGESFGDLAFIHHGRTRAATVIAAARTEVLCLSRNSFERVFGCLEMSQKRHYTMDPRKTIASFYQPKENRDFFAVYRPCSKQALSKMLNGTAVGKGLNVKGKSSKMNHLSGFVPFLQITENCHKSRIENSPVDARVTIYYTSDCARKSALNVLERFLEELLQKDRSLSGRIKPLSFEDGYADLFGLQMPEIVMREAYIMQQDITARIGWETGRQSEPAFMDMNLHAVRGSSSPKIVLYQFDKEDAMNPHGLLVAYAEAKVKPVVSDFDTFTVGSRGVTYDKVPPEQLEIAKWALKQTENVLSTPGHASWNSRWIQVLTEAHQKGFHATIPPFGFGDPTSYASIEAIIAATKDSGAVRHGAECFNYYFPQELDAEYLVVWSGFDDEPGGKQWCYITEPELRQFLLARIDEGYTFPVNPVWPVRDVGWYEVVDALQQRDASRCAQNCWFPQETGILTTIQSLNREFPDGFTQVETLAADGLQMQSESPIAFARGDLEHDTHYHVALHLAATRRWRLVRDVMKVRSSLRKFMKTVDEDRESDSSSPRELVKSHSDGRPTQVHKFMFPSKSDIFEYKGSSS